MGISFFSQLAVILSIFILPFSHVLAGPVSDKYELIQYGFGAGGTDDSVSAGNAYTMTAIAGEQSGASASAGTHILGQGLVFTMLANVPDAPSFTNPGSTYDRLKIIIDTGDNPTDATYAVAISDDDWVTTRYIQDDLTIGSALGIEDFLGYETGWGGTAGVFISRLNPSTTYAVKVKARTGDKTESGWSLPSAATTSIPSLTFGVSGNTVTFNTLEPTNSWTDSTQFTKVTTSTNAYNGYTVYAYNTGPLTDMYGNKIDAYGSLNANPSLWTGTGFGYTTTDDNLAGGVQDRFTNGGPKYAGFTVNVPGDPVADHLAKVEENPIVGEWFNIGYRVTASESHKAGSYSTTILYIVVPEY